MRRLLRLVGIGRRRPPEVREASRREPGGFTLVEVVTVALVMGTLARMATPNLHEVLIKARAAEVAAEFETIRLAVFNYHADHLRWPADSYTGQVPTGLEEYLPEGYDFSGAGYRMDWENWVLPNGLPQQPTTGVLLGISVVTDDDVLGSAVLDLLGGSMAAYSLGTKYTFVVEGI